MMNAPPPPFGVGPPPFGNGGAGDGGGLATEQMTGNVMRNRDLLYRLMISQLFYDGYQQVAVQLTNMLAVDKVCPPSDRLYHVVASGLEVEAERKIKSSGGTALPPAVPTGVPEVVGPGLDLEFASDVEPSVAEPALYETAYVTSHKGNCRAGAFTADGSLCATGSTDASIKILDVERMLAKSNMDAKGGEHGHPVIRTLYDHVDEVTCLKFHPKEAILASGSRDCSVKIFDYSKASAKKAMRTITDAEQISDIAFHPTGDYLLVGCEQPVIRVYDVSTGQCFVGQSFMSQHQDIITGVQWSADGKLYVSASADGNIKVWDGVSSQCVATFQQAHEGIEVCSVQFTRNGKYILSSGRDSMAKLWELSTVRCLVAYTGAGATGKQEHRAQAVFNHSEDYVMFPDEATTSLCCWDSRNASRKQLLSLGHNGVVRHIVHSPSTPAFLTCSDDFRARFWYKRNA